MTYDAETFRKTFSQMSDEELLRRLHLDMFTEESRVVAEEEAAKRNLVLDGEKVERTIERDHKIVREHKSQKYVHLITALTAAAGASQFGIVGGLLFVIPGRFLGEFIDTRLNSFVLRTITAIGVFVVSFAVATLLKAIAAEMLRNA